MTTEAPLMQPFDAEPEIKNWHNGYRAACKDICERFGLDNTDEIELLVKENEELPYLRIRVDGLKAELDEAKRGIQGWKKAAWETGAELAYEQRKEPPLDAYIKQLEEDQKLFHVFQSDMNELREEHEVLQKMYAGQCKLTDELNMENITMRSTLQFVRSLMENDQWIQAEAEVKSALEDE